MTARQTSRFALALFISIIDVKVRARVIEVPKGCSKSGSICAVQNTSEVLFKKLGWGDLRAGQGSSYLVLENGQLRLVSGQFLLSAEEPIEITTLFGQFKLNHGQAFFDVHERIVKFTNISSDVTYSPRGEEKFYDLPQSFTSYLTQINNHGVAEAGYPRLAEIKPLIKGWALVYGKHEARRFKSDLEGFSVAWSKAQKVVGPWYSSVVEREVASEREEEERQAALRARQKLENEKWRSMFRQRNFIGVDPGDTHE